MILPRESEHRKRSTAYLWKTPTFKGQMEEGNLMKMEEWFKRLEEKQRGVL